MAAKNPLLDAILARQKIQSVEKEDTSGVEGSKNPMLAEMLAQRGTPTSPERNPSLAKASASTKEILNFQGKPFIYQEEKQRFVFAAHHGQETTQESWSQPIWLPEHGSIRVPLAPCVYRMTDYTYHKKEPIELQRCVQKLGVLRCLQREAIQLNHRLPHGTLEEEALGQTRFMELLSNCGIYQKVSEMILQHQPTDTGYKDKGHTKIPQLTVMVEGLDDFLTLVEKLVPELAQARHEILHTQSVSFYPGLGELFSPGAPLTCFPEGLEGTPVGCSVIQTWYDEELNKATNKIKRRFILVLEFIVSVGDKLCFVAASDVYPEFHDPSRNQPLKDLAHRRLWPEQNVEDTTLLQRLQQRGEFYASVATKNHYLEYHPNSFYPIIGGGWSNNALRPLSKGGRVMVDVKRGIQEGHIPIRGSADGMSDTVKEAIRLFDQSKRTGVKVPFRSCFLPGFDGFQWQDTEHSDRTNLWQCWPMLTGFSFTARVWGKLLLSLPKETSVSRPRGVGMTQGKSPSRRSIMVRGVELAALGGTGASASCNYISFQEQAFDQLVLAEDKKELIRAVARNAGGTMRSDEDDVTLADDDDDDDYIGIDVVANKGAASIFLLHGPAGTGKTLTAEAISELLRKPLYVVTAGDLGTTASDVEKTLGSVLELCQTWDALVLIDEADIFLEARHSSEIERNALVCVMLRLLEYYSGCLFLSSNRSAGSIDAAIASRITVMLEYPPLDTEGRMKVWKNLVELVPPLPSDPATNVVPGRILQNARKASKYREIFTDIDYRTLAAGYELNGRQIKNSIVLARALARERGVPLSMSILQRSITAVAGGAAAVRCDATSGY